MQHQNHRIEVVHNIYVFLKSMKYSSHKQECPANVLASLISPPSPELIAPRTFALPDCCRCARLISKECETRPPRNHQQDEYVHNNARTADTTQTSPSSLSDLLQNIRISKLVNLWMLFTELTVELRLKSI